jgi:hypothetical protein
LRSLILAISLVSSQAPAVSDWHNELAPPGRLSVAADPACPLDAQATRSIVAEVLSRNSISPANPPFTLDIALSCYQLDTLSKRSWAVMTQFRNEAGNTRSFRRMGVLPNAGENLNEFLVRRVDRALESMLLTYLDQPSQQTES